MAKNPTSLHVGVWSRDCLQMLRLFSCSTSERVLVNAIQGARGKGEPASVFLAAEWQAAGWTHAWQMAFQRVFMNHLGCVQWLQTTLTTKPEGLLHKEGGGRGRAARAGGRKESQEAQTLFFFIFSQAQDTENNQHLAPRALSQPAATAPRLVCAQPSTTTACQPPLQPSADKLHL